MSTMISFSNNDIATNFLSDDKLRAKCPYAFLNNPSNPSVSEKYVPATTMDVVHDMRKLGWLPVEAKQCRNKKGSSGIRSFHMIAFQNPDFHIDRGGEIDSYPRIILTNSFDGFNSFILRVGLYRCICSNGLVVSDAEYANVSIRHIYYTFEELRTTVAKMVAAVPEQVKAIDTMSNTMLSMEQKKDFATKAIRIKKGFEATDTNILVTDEEVYNIISPRRKEDEGDSLWNTFNVIQEYTIKGGNYLKSGSKNKMRKQRGVTSIKKDIELNTKLWTIAKEYVLA